MDNYKRSPINYMGNKFKLLQSLLPIFPETCDIFVDLFGGSGVISMNYQGTVKSIYNEFNDNIVEMISMIVNEDPKKLNEYWQSKIEYYNLDTQSLTTQERVDRSGYERRLNNFLRFREDYNKSNPKDYRDLYLLMCYSINHLIRFNSDNEFNVSSGADSYNEKNYKDVVDMHNIFNNKHIEIRNSNALDFNLDELTSDSFIYCDPPYLNTEAVYNEKRAFGGWDIECDYKLFAMLEEANKRGIKWGLSNVFENRGIVNQHLIDWCNKNGWRVLHFDRNYNPFSRGNSNNDEVYIYNYSSKNAFVKNSLW